MIMWEHINGSLGSFRTNDWIGNSEDPNTGIILYYNTDYETTSVFLLDGVLPEGVRLYAYPEEHKVIIRGQLSGTSLYKTYKFVIRAQNEDGSELDDTYCEIILDNTINALGEPLAWYTTPEMFNRTITSLDQFEYRFRLNNDVPVQTFYKIYGEFPTGITLDSTGNLLGSATLIAETTVYKFTLACDITGLYEDEVRTITLVSDEFELTVEPITSGMVNPIFLNPSEFLANVEYNTNVTLNVRAWIQPTQTILYNLVNEVNAVQSDSLASLGEITVNLTTFERYVTPTESMILVFSYNGNNNQWYLRNIPVNISNYGISYEGEPVNGNVITLTYLYSKLPEALRLSTFSGLIVGTCLETSSLTYKFIVEASCPSTGGSSRKQYIISTNSQNYNNDIIYPSDNHLGTYKIGDYVYKEIIVENKNFFYTFDTVEMGRLLPRGLSLTFDKRQISSTKYQTVCIISGMIEPQQETGVLVLPIRWFRETIDRTTNFTIEVLIGKDESLQRVYVGLPHEFINDWVEQYEVFNQLSELTGDEKKVYNDFIVENNEYFKYDDVRTIKPITVPIKVEVNGSWSVVSITRKKSDEISVSYKALDENGNEHNTYHKEQTESGDYITDSIRVCIDGSNISDPALITNVDYRVYGLRNTATQGKISPLSDSEKTLSVQIKIPDYSVVNLPTLSKIISETTSYNGSSDYIKRQFDKDVINYNSNDRYGFKYLPKIYLLRSFKSKVEHLENYLGTYDKPLEFQLSDIKYEPYYEVLKDENGNPVVENGEEVTELKYYIIYRNVIDCGFYEVERDSTGQPILVDGKMVETETLSRDIKVGESTKTIRTSEPRFSILRNKLLKQSSVEDELLEWEKEWSPKLVIMYLRPESLSTIVPLINKLNDRFVNKKYVSQYICCEPYFMNQLREEIYWFFTYYSKNGSQGWREGVYDGNTPIQPLLNKPDLPDATGYTLLTEAKTPYINSSSELGEVSLNYDMLANQIRIRENMTIEFTYQNGYWLYNGSSIDLNDYGLSYDGTAVNGNTIEIVFEKRELWTENYEKAITTELQLVIEDID